MGRGELGWEEGVEEIISQQRHDFADTLRFR
jgi:hypothetical protein